MSRLAFLTTMAGFPWGGSEVLWSLAAERALQQRHEVFVVVFDWSRSHPAVLRLEREGATVRARPRRRGRGLLSRVLRRVVPRLSERLEGAWTDLVVGFEPDALCISQGSVWELFEDAEVMRLATRIQCPVVHLCHLSNDMVVVSDAGRRAVGDLFSRAARTLFVAQANRAMTERQLARCLPNAQVVRNPVNLPGTEPLAARAESSVPIFASVASLNLRHKGQDVLLEILGSDRWRGREWECRFYGEGPDRLFLERLANHYGIADQVRFMGHVQDIREVWRSSDLLVMPSRMEGTPLALVEAMLCGRPAAVTDVGGMAEWIVEPECGWVAEAASARSFGAALERAWQGRQQWPKIGEAARSRALQQLDPDPGATLLDLLLDEGRRRAKVAGAVDSE